MPVPALEGRPNTTGFEWLWEAFVVLSSCRQSGMGIGPIPWTAIQRYAEVHGFDEEETWLVHGVTRHLDDIFIRHHNEKQRG